jgi:hypothetical protein
MERGQRVHASQNGEKIHISTPMRREKGACKDETLFYVYLLLKKKKNLLGPTHSLRGESFLT